MGALGDAMDPYHDACELTHPHQPPPGPPSSKEALTRSDMRKELRAMQDKLIREISYMKEQLVREHMSTKEQLLLQRDFSRGHVSQNASRELSGGCDNWSIRPKENPRSPEVKSNMIREMPCGGEAWPTHPKDHPRYHEAKTNVINRFSDKIDDMHKSMKEEMQKLRSGLSGMSVNGIGKPSHASGGKSEGGVLSKTKPSISTPLPGVVDDAEAEDRISDTTPNNDAQDHERCKNGSKDRKTKAKHRATNRCGTESNFDSNVTHGEAHKLEQKKKVPGRADGTARAVEMFGAKGANHADLDKAEYSVTEFYRDIGFCQRVARHDVFSYVTLIVICLNAVYLGIDADYNDADNLYDANLAFIMIENLFALFFIFEWVIRFGAFKRKIDCLRDMWFKFDSFLMVLSVLETWLMPILLSGISLPTSPLRLLRLLRLARMARLVRSFPELVTMIKGGFAAQRAVTASFAALIALIYIFSIVMKMIFSDARDPYVTSRFDTIPLAMWTLLIDGTFMDNIGEVTRNIYEKENPTIAVFGLIVFVIFSMLSALTVLNMLIGVQCEVVSAVAAREKDDSEVGLMKRTVLVLLKALDEDQSGAIDHQEILALLDDPEALEILNLLQIDVNYLLNHLGMLFTVFDDISIADVMEMMLQFRGDRHVTMKDMIDLQAYSMWVLNSDPNERTNHINRMFGAAVGGDIKCQEDDV
jgi:hypothetical protein